MFKFNFSSNDTDDGIPTKDSPDELEWLPAECLTIDDSSKVDESCLCTFKCGQFTINYHDESATIQKATCTMNSIAIAEQNQSDLLPAKYEGGLKIWECTYDLAGYLVNDSNGICLAKCKILDLGCGAGLLGILAIKLGAFVTFQDYNKEVLQTTTIPNVLANLSVEDRKKLVDADEKPEEKLCQFYCGDWGSFPECYHSNNDNSLFDYILTSETIYNPTNHTKLSSLFRKCLKKSGSVYLAAKTHYFGVGGGTRQFEDIIAGEGKMTSNVCWKSEGGVLREILQIRFKD